MDKRVPLAELEARMNRFRAKLDATNPDWEIAVVFSKVNRYYFAGTMQDGMFCRTLWDMASAGSSFYTNLHWKNV